MKSNENNFLIQSSRFSLLFAGMLCALSLLRGDALPMNTGQGGTDEKALTGVWELFVTTEGANKKEPPVIIVVQLIGNRLSGKVSVPTVDPSATGIKTTGSKDLPLEDLNFNGRKLTFRVDEDGSSFDADLRKIGDDEFEGRWRSRIQGRWKGSKNEFEGMVKLRRKK